MVEIHDTTNEFGHRVQVVTGLNPNGYDYECKNPSCKAKFSDLVYHEACPVCGSPRLKRRDRDTPIKE